MPNLDGRLDKNCSGFVPSLAMPLIVSIDRFAAAVKPLASLAVRCARKSITSHSVAVASQATFVRAL